jgi:competence protein ComEC
MVIGTHPDSDHVGGLVDVLDRYTVNTILRTENTGNSATWNAYAQASAYEDAQLLYARSGQVFALGNDVFLKVLYPLYDTAEIDSNASSIIVQIIYGDTKILLTGDSPKRIEEYLVQEGFDLESDVLKAGHHGSRTSTSEMFLEAVNPKYAIISAGKDNRYGHPHLEVTDMLFNHRVETYSTAEEGTITFQSNGSKIWRKMD